MTHNRLLYHCMKCGRVAHVELNAPAPRCCGRDMARAGAETVRDDTLLASQCHGSHEVASDMTR